MKIRYLKVTEEFELEVPDPLIENEILTVRISDYDLVTLLNSNFKIKPDLDDDTLKGIELLCQSYILTTRTLKLAKTQLHLRKLNRVSSCWIELKKNERKKRVSKISPEDLERIQYLKDNYDKIVENCLKHDWFIEFYKLNKDIDSSKKKKDIVDEWRRLKKALIN